jgi:hypothetical protein
LIFSSGTAGNAQDDNAKRRDRHFDSIQLDTVQSILAKANFINSPLLPPSREPMLDNSSGGALLNWLAQNGFGRVCEQRF